MEEGSRHKGGRSGKSTKAGGPKEKAIPTKTGAASAASGDGPAKTGGVSAKRAPSRRGRARGAAFAFAFAPGLESFVSSSPALMSAAEAIGKRIRFSVAPKTMSNEPIQAQRGRLSERSLEEFRPKPDAAAAAADRLKQLGFSIERIGRFAITASGPAELVSQVERSRSRS